MNAASTAPQCQTHPSPHRHRVSQWRIWFGLVGAPLAWNLQLLVNYGLVSHGCYPHDEPLGAPFWAGMPAVTTTVEAFAMVTCIAAAMVSWSNWQHSREEKPGGVKHLVEGGDGRTRFMAISGMLTSALFLIATCLSAFTLAAVPPCAG